MVTVQSPAELLLVLPFCAHVTNLIITQSGQWIDIFLISGLFRAAVVTVCLHEPSYMHVAQLHHVSRGQACLVVAVV